MEFYNRLDAFAQNVERHVLIGRVDGVAFQSESHQHRLDAQYLLKGRDDGDASATAHGQRLPSECFLESLLGSLIGGEGDGADVALPAVHGRYLYLYRSGSNALDVVGKQL